MDNAPWLRHARKEAWEVVLHVMRPVLRDAGAGTPKVLVGEASEYEQEVQDVVLVLQGLPLPVSDLIQGALTHALDADTTDVALRFRWDDELNCTFSIESDGTNGVPVPMVGPRRVPDLFD